MARLLETVYLEESASVDAENGVIAGVKLLGEVSRNKRRYTPEAMRQAAPLYEGKKLFVNHPQRKRMGEERQIGDWAGVFRNVRYVDGKGIFADSHLLKSSPYFETIVEAAAKFPSSIGHSHVADGHSRRVSGEEIVESIKEVFSVDLVTDPATTKGMFESVRVNKMKKPLSEILESLAESPAKLALEGRVKAGAVKGTLLVESAEDATEEDLEYSALVAAIESMHAPEKKPARKPEPKRESESDDEDKSAALIESLNEKLDKLTERIDKQSRRDEARQLIEAAGGRATEQLVAEVAGAGDSSAMKRLVDGFSGEKLGKQKPRLESYVNDTTAYPKDHESFIASLR